MTSSSPSSQKVSQDLSENAEYIITPYWNLDEDISSTPFENLMYFGIEADEDGINTEDDGYNNLSEFVTLSEGKKTYLIVRMLDNDSNMKVLDSKKIQENIVSESIELAQQNGFSGVVLDLEIQGIPFESFVSSITDFNNLYAQEVKRKGLIFGTFIYGDAYFRARPFNLSEIGKSADMIFVMAYDFSKARGNPGPNFPFDNVSTYGYSFKKMVSDFSNDVPKSKLTVIFGMFGYDWIIDEEGRGKKQAASKSTFEFQKFLTECVSSSTCKVQQDSSSEAQITYTKDSENHVIWFESEESVKKKIEYLRTQGINSIGYWAYSYF